MASLKKLAISATGTMLVRDATGALVSDENGQWSITVHSPGTKQYQAAKHRFDENRNNTLAAILGKGETKQNPEDETRAVAEFLADVTISFNNFDYEGKHGREAYKAAYMDLEIGHVAIDLNKYLGDRGNFLPAKQLASSDSSDMQHG